MKDWKEKSENFPAIRISAQRTSLDSSWQRLGAETQIPSHLQNRSPLDLVIGLDFGTAYTKVVIGETRARYAVPFHTLLSLRNRYLLPSLLAMDTDGSFHLGQSGQMRYFTNNIKMKLLMGQYDESIQIEATAFLAQVLRYARYWFFQTHSNTYARHTIRWWLNVGLPSDSWQQSDLKNAYQKIVMAAWDLSVAKNPINPQTTQYALYAPETLQFIGERLGHQERICIIPEFAAQITSYIRSPRRQSDLHLLVDVGAGTLDVTTFNAHRDQVEDIFPIFEARVAPLGSRYYVAQLLSGIQYQATWNEEDSSAKIDRFAQSTGLRNEELEFQKRKFREKVVDVVRNVVHATQQKRYIKSPHWKTGVLTFLCGGGSSIPLYETVLQENHLLRLISLQKPDTLAAESLGSSDFHRLSVAYGLSFNALDIGKVRPRSQVPDDYDVMQRHEIPARCPGCGAIGTCYCS